MHNELEKVTHFSSCSNYYNYMTYSEVPVKLDTQTSCEFEAGLH